MVFAADVAPLGRRQCVWLPEEFDVIVPAVRRAEVVPVATIRRDAMDLVIECVGIDWRLFRPFLDAPRGPWTMEPIKVPAQIELFPPTGYRAFKGGSGVAAR